jgi:metallo-beta-lactamase family protein
MGQRFKLKAEVKVINGLSAHADHQELVDYIGHFDRTRLQRIFLVHGEERGAEALRASLLGSGFGSVEIPDKGARFEL